MIEQFYTYMLYYQYIYIDSDEVPLGFMDFKYFMN